MRTPTRCNLFAGIDLKACLKEWNIKLTIKSQLAALASLESLPNMLGIIRGPWGTVKTMFDVVVALLIPLSLPAVQSLYP